MDDTPRLGLPHIHAGQALKHITHNEALQRLDILVQASVDSASDTLPPSDPLEGKTYLVPAGAGGVWAGHTHEIAAWQINRWVFLDPAPGWQVFDRASESLLVFSGSAWVAIAGPELRSQGINTSADPTNRLAVAAPATLLTHEGAGHQLKINKASAADTASLLFQSNWSGRAEMGLMGDDSWRIKLSPDGVNWIEAMTIGPDGAVRLAGSLRPAADNSHSLGASGARWGAIWSATGTIQTSDSRDKIDIAPSDLGLDFILALNPVRYRWRAGADKSDHYGLLAQEVLATARKHGVGRFGGHVLAEPEDEQSQQALRYSSFIAPLIAAIQTLNRRIEKLEKAVASDMQPAP